VQRVIEGAEAGKGQCIVVKDLSRWGRNYIEVGDFLEQKFPAWGVRFTSLNDAYDSATLNGTTGGIDISFRNLIYDMYSQDLSEKVRSAKMSAAIKGKFTNSMTFYGYTKDPEDIRKLVIDPPAAEVIKRIFGLAARDYSPAQISQILNDEKIPTAQERKIQLGGKHRWKTGYPMFWYDKSISWIIRDERYTGKLIYGKSKRTGVGKTERIAIPKSDWIVVPDAIPAIITEEQFKAATVNVTKRKQHDGKHTKSVLLFTRKIKCGCCGMGLKTVHYKHDKTKIKYRCYTPRFNKDFGCSDDLVCEKDIADVVLAALQRQIALADEARKMLETKNEQLKPSIEKLRVEVARLQRLIEKTKTEKMALWEKYHNRKISAEAFQRETEKADDKATKYAAKIPEVQAKITALEMETGRENLFIERFSKQTGLQELTRAAVDEFINEVRFYSADRIEVIFNFADEYAKIAALIEQPKRKGRASK
jgi:DNA invertase Pin-like site-specific DNA recombinase